MKTQTKIYLSVTLVSIVIATLVYCTYNLNKKFNHYSYRANNTFNHYSDILVGAFEQNNRVMENPDLRLYNSFDNGTLTWCGEHLFMMLCDFPKNNENFEKINNLKDRYFDAIEMLEGYYYTNLKKLKDESITTQQIDTLINYNNEVIKIIKELKQVK